MGISPLGLAAPAGEHHARVLHRIRIALVGRRVVLVAARPAKHLIAAHLARVDDLGGFAGWLFAFSPHQPPGSATMLPGVPGTTGAPGIPPGGIPPPVPGGGGGAIGRPAPGLGTGLGGMPPMLPGLGAPGVPPGTPVPPIISSWLGRPACCMRSERMVPTFSKIAFFSSAWISWEIFRSCSNNDFSTPPAVR